MPSKPKKSPSAGSTPSSDSVPCPPPALSRSVESQVSGIEPTQVSGFRSQPSTTAPTRAALTRIEQIHQKLRAVQRDGTGTHRVTATTLARDLEVSPSTVKLDLETLKVQFKAPIAWDARRGTYYYTDPDYELRPLLWLDAVEVLSLMVASRVSATWRAFPLGRALASALGKIAPNLGGAVSLHPQALDAVFSAPQDPATDAEARHFVLLRDAILQRREVRLVYQKPIAGAAPEMRLVHPLRLVCLPDGCLLVAHDPTRRGRRNFDLLRIRDAQLTGITFEWPEDFDIDQVLAHSFGRFIGEGKHEVRLLFAASYAPYVRERPWHSTQTLLDRPDGTVEATYRVNHLQDLEHRVLSCGGQAEVLAPTELRTRVYTAAAALAACHA